MPTHQPVECDADQDGDTDHRPQRPVTVEPEELDRRVVVVLEEEEGEQDHQHEQCDQLPRSAPLLVARRLVTVLAHVKRSSPLLGAASTRRDSPAATFVTASPAMIGTGAPDSTVTVAPPGSSAIAMSLPRRWSLNRIEAHP